MPQQKYFKCYWTGSLSWLDEQNSVGKNEHVQNPQKTKIFERETTEQQTIGISKKALKQVSAESQYSKNCHFDICLHFA